MTRYCTDCKYYPRGFLSVCQHPDARDLTGRHRPLFEMRSLNGACGEPANLFVLKLPPPPKRSWWARFWGDV